MRILVADDEAASAQGLKALLELIGHHVVGPAADGDEAVRLAGREHPDLAILDIDMPRVSGLEAVVRITRIRPIPVILLTGHSSPEYVDRAAELPVFNYLTKPAGADRLVPAIRLARARFDEWSALHGEVGELRHRIEDRKLVERAKGILMKARGIGEAEAYRLLQRESQQRSRSMAEVARSVIAAEGLLTRAAS
ncbi:MAG TPA: response regulator [Longimicrobiaceae bacterium]|nr:response regulator [Longimicrobiaceae bacterium]